MKPLTTFKLSINNLKQKPFRTVCLLAVVAILTSVFFGGSILAASLENGLYSLQSRLGADIMVVPEGNDSNVEDILLKAEPSNFYFSADIAEEIEKIEGVDKVTTQFYMTPLSSACCSSVIPIIAFDPETDFLIQPWITKVYNNPIKDGEMIIGSAVLPLVDNTLMFFNKYYPIIANLKRTGTGLDGSVYVTKDTMKQLIIDAKEVGVSISTDENVGESVSAIFIKIAPAYDSRLIAREIKQKVSNVDTIISQHIVSNIGDSLRSLESYIHLITAVIWVLGILVILIVFSVTLNERKKEFAILRILGATRKKLVEVVLTESVLVSIVGGIIGLILTSLIIFPFSDLISSKLQLPYLQPQNSSILAIIALSLILSVLVGLLASIHGALKISKAETYLTMREGE
ncbi:ABC transporter permease [Proteiniborus sp. DW1]|uniref:ABC transporter permease n=1 Tax=Proteiniborus sp. DW1 TaxID=1889883 RepID=UPI00135670BD|nr:ABC transporter permease [Proteiniborus sp. DW1]